MQNSNAVRAMGVIRAFILILGFVIVAAAIYGVLGILLPESVDSRVAGWILYGLGGALILIAYLRRKRAERNARGSEDSPHKSPEGSPNDPNRNMERLRERIRLRKGRKGHSDE